MKRNYFKWTCKKSMDNKVSSLISSIRYAMEDSNNIYQLYKITIKFMRVRARNEWQTNVKHIFQMCRKFKKIIKAMQK